MHTLSMIQPTPSPSDEYVKNYQLFVEKCYIDKDVRISKFLPKMTSEFQFIWKTLDLWDAVQLRYIRVNIIIDTGCSLEACISPEIIYQRGWQSEVKSNEKIWIQVADGTLVSSDSHIEIKCLNDGQSSTVKFHVLQQSMGLVLGVPAVRKLSQDDTLNW